MDFRDTPNETAWRQDVRAFIREQFPPEARDPTFGGMNGVNTARPLRAVELEARAGGDVRSTESPARREWRRRLAQKGWIAPAWPAEYGGAGLTSMEQFVLNEEMAEARAPFVGGMGVMMVGPTLLTHGTEEQKREHLPRILAGDVNWCQGFSEPGSGSDLASLQTRAVANGDDFIINGQKIWTSGAHQAHWMFMLARTDPDVPKHRGITYFLLPMNSPGITIQPLVTMAGPAAFNQVFFDNVRVSRRNVVGEVNAGWYVGVTTLDFERSSIGTVVNVRQQVEDLVRFAREGEQSMLARRASVRMELADRMIEANVARMLSYRVVSMQRAGRIPNYEASLAKLYLTELQQRVARTGLSLIGMYGQLLDSHSHWSPRGGAFAYDYVNSVRLTIYGGSSEIQRNIIATRGLGLPRG